MNTSTSLTISQFTLTVHSTHISYEHINLPHYITIHPHCTLNSHILQTHQPRSLYHNSPSLNTQLTYPTNTSTSLTISQFTLTVRSTHISYKHINLTHYITIHPHCTLNSHILQTHQPRSLYHNSPSLNTQLTYPTNTSTSLTISQFTLTVRSTHRSCKHINLTHYITIHPHCTLNSHIL